MESIILTLVYYTVLISTIDREIERYRRRELKKGGEGRKKRERENYKKIGKKNKICIC